MLSLLDYALESILASKSKTYNWPNVLYGVTQVIYALTEIRLRMLKNFYQVFFNLIIHVFSLVPTVFVLLLSIVMIPLLSLSKLSLKVRHLLKIIKINIFRLLFYYLIDKRWHHWHTRKTMSRFWMDKCLTINGTYLSNSTCQDTEDSTCKAGTWSEFRFWGGTFNLKFLNKNFNFLVLERERGTLWERPLGQHKV